MEDASHDEARDQVTRLIGVLRGLVRSRSEFVGDVADHPGMVWVGPTTPVSLRSGAVPGQVLVELAPDAAGYDDLAGLVDELHDNPETLELVIANALLTVAEPENDTAPLIREHLLTQHVVADRLDDETLRISIGAGAVPMVHDAHLLATVDGIDLSGAIRKRAKLAEQAAIVNSATGDLVAEWMERIEVDPAVVDVSVDMRPAIVLRTRGVASSLAFYDAILASLADPDIPVPLGLAQLVRPIEAAERVAALADSEAISAGELVSDALFPLSSNVEQRDVLARLGVDSGVVVEGPPGTGKTHTIANLMSALLAKGQRVLVVSEKAHALHVLRDMLPTGIRDLTVSIADVRQDSFDAVADGATTIAERKAGYSDGVAEAEIADLMARRDQARSRREQIMRDLWELRAAEVEVHEWVAGDYRGTAAEVVRAVRAAADRFDWLPAPVDGVVPPLDADEFDRFVTLMRSTGGATDRLAQRFFNLSDHLPDQTAMDQICARISSRPREPMTGSGSLLSVLDGVESDRLLRIKEICEHLAVSATEVRGFPSTMVDMADRLLGGQATHLWSRLTALSPVIAEAARRDRQLGAHAVIVDGAGPGDAALFDAAADHLAAGGRWRSKLRRSPAQRAVEESAVRALVDGREPTDAASLRFVADHLTVTEAVYQAHRLLADLHVPIDTSGSRSAQLNLLVRLDTQLSWISDLVARRDRLVHELEAISPGGPRPRTVAAVAEVAQQARLIAATNDAVIAETELADTAYALSHEVEKGPSPEGDALVAALANADADAIRQARRAYVAARAEYDEQIAVDLLGLRLRSKAPELFAAVVDNPEDPAWVGRARDLSAAWSWRRAHTWAAERSDPHREAELAAALDQVEVDIAATTTRLAAARAWRACLARTTVTQIQALQSYRDHMINLGKGSGKHASRFRAAARESMVQAQSAVPAWIMSISQVSQILPPTGDAFDVVIVDEASQADVTSAFLLWLAPRVIVVGDDRQCAPTGLAGTTLDEAFAKLDAQLPDLPHYLRDSLTPRTSLFALLRSRLGHVVALREHFRSMPEIIEFSSRQFYRGSPLVPVRQFGADRLDPLRTVRVEGEAQGSGAALTNEAEAQAISEAIEGCLADPAYVGLDFGVIALQGTKQVELLERTIRDRVGEQAWRARRIRVGSPPDFQGDERRVVFLSMVVSDPGAISALTRAESQRRFNVAASRAMDQLWLFHSIDLDDLRDNDLRYSLLGYMQANAGTVTAPMPHDVPDHERVEPFDNLLEQQVFNRLVALGYHVTPKVTVNNRDIDLVVTGADARMAVECDADTFRTTGRQARSDLERERELRRCGWEFVRVRESEFAFDPDRVIASVAAALDARGCKPGSVIDSAAPAPDDGADAERAAWQPIDLSAGD
ncbi:AAA domain-containing protein [Gordonia sp. ABSL1-1]|uniref:AAA domain-containing protein n=1 Tax=Gordonia sp. ABSL1-1 TaxID=3053923 RepID=UPI002573BE01|nr:AAA domain-containing protein [Gordonia sp. ABSL1-1]MDL9938507.1 AAA domain-containing protein [Gordonia sp. ABSL1-1]